VTRGARVYALVSTRALTESDEEVLGADDSASTTSISCCIWACVLCWL